MLATLSREGRGKKSGRGDHFRKLVQAYLS
jgi:hypothetical protein